MKSADGRDAENIMFGSTLPKTGTRHAFDYLIANPPYGKEWKATRRRCEQSTSAATPAASAPDCRASATASCSFCSTCSRA